MPIIRDLSQPAIDSPMLQKLSGYVSDYGMDSPDSIMGVGAPRLPTNIYPENALASQVAKRLPRNMAPGTYMGTDLIGNLKSYLTSKIIHGIRDAVPATQPIIDHPGDTILKYLGLK